MNNILLPWKKADVGTLKSELKKKTQNNIPFYRFQEENEAMLNK